MNAMYDHRLFADAVATLANRNKHNDTKVREATAQIISMIQMERPGQDAHDWNKWIKDMDWRQDKPIEAVLLEVDRVIGSPLPLPKPPVA